MRFFSMDLKKYIANVVDFPKKGIIFRDVTPVFQNGEAFTYVIDELADYAKKVGANVIAGPEARGFALGAAIAYKLHVGFVTIRKPNKLPREQITEDYDLEYGKNTICVHTDAFEPGDKVLIVDDLLATGGTALASARLVERLGAEVAGFAFIVNLKDLPGLKKIQKYNVLYLVEYEGE